MDDSDPNRDSRGFSLDSSESAEDYEVGYKKPPKHSRFRRGQSGNPRGRPRGSKSWKSLLEEELNRKITVVEGGKQKQVTLKRALVRRAINDALAKSECRMLNQIGAFSEAAAPGDEDEHVVRRFTLIFDGEKQQTYENGELVQDHAAEREQARRLAAGDDTEPE